MTNTQKIWAGVLGVCALLGASAFFGLTPFGKTIVQSTEQSAQQFGSVVDSNVPWYTSGYKYGAANALYSSATLTIANGTDQAIWNNNTGQTVVITNASIYLNGNSSTAVSSSTYSIAVGATTTATIAEPYTLNWEKASSTSDFPDLLITNFNFATNTPAGIPTTAVQFSLLSDNFSYHASSTSYLSGAEILVPPGANVFAKLDSVCVAEGPCETSTSTNRGFTTISVPLRYYYSSPN